MHRADDGSVQHAELRLGANLVMLGEAREDSWMGGEAPDPLRSTISLYVVVPAPVVVRHLRPVRRLSGCYSGGMPRYGSANLAISPNAGAATVPP